MVEEKTMIDASSLQREMPDSQIYRLLKKNASIEEGLTKAERAKAVDFILNPIYATDAPACWLCKPNHVLSVYDLGLCTDHAFYTLCTRK